MTILFNEQYEKICTDPKAAVKFFHGNKPIAVSLFARINALEEAETLKDIIKMPSFHFHNLHNKGRKDLRGYFAIDVKSRKEPWRIILQPLDADEQPFENPQIDVIADTVRIVWIEEVSNHYE